MDYSTAKAIRGRSLSSMITQKIRAGGGVGSSIGRSISQKMRAKGVGIKEKFDPLNVAKFLTGGSNLAPAILGRLTGRKQSDINYFSGGRKTATQVGKSSSLGQMQTAPTDSLSSLFTFVRQSYEQDLKIRETERTFQEEKSNEEQRRHNEFLKTLKNYTSGATAVMVKPEKEGGGFLDFLNLIKKMIADAVSGVIETITKMFSWLNELRILQSVAPWLARLASAASAAVSGGAIGTLLSLLLPASAVGALLFLLSSEMDKIRANPNAPEYKNNPFAMTLRGEAATLEEAGRKNIQRAQKETRRPDVELFVKSQATDDELIENIGADRATLQQWLKDNPNPRSVFKPEMDGEIAKQESARRLKQGAFRRSEIEVQNMPEGMTATPAAPTSEGSSSSPMSSTQTPMVPVSSAPMSSPVYDSSSENADLNMMGNVGSGASAAPIITSSVKNSSTEQPMPATASIRDSTDVLSRVMSQSAAYV